MTERPRSASRCQQPAEPVFTPAWRPPRAEWLRGIRANGSAGDFVVSVRGSGLRWGARGGRRWSSGWASPAFRVGGTPDEPPDQARPAPERRTERGADDENPAHDDEPGLDGEDGADGAV